MKSRAITLGHGYFLDEEMTLKKIQKSEKTGKTREVTKGYFTSLPSAMRAFAGCLVKDGIEDGKIRTVRHAIKKLEDAYAALTSLEFESIAE